MKPTRKLYLKLMDYFLGYHDTPEEDQEVIAIIKEMIEECFGKGACDV